VIPSTIIKYELKYLKSKNRKIMLRSKYFQIVDYQSIR